MSDQTRVMIRTKGGDWHVPSVSSYSLERELQDILLESPQLIPGVDSAAVADELPIPGSGQLDLFAVESDGSMTLIECKLASNAEVRRAVVGQIASYASGLWRMTFEDLDEAFRIRTGSSLTEAVGEIADASWDQEEFRRAVANALSSGQFRLVIAVDAITEELKRIVEYMNAHTTADVEILAFEIGYVAEGDVEILLPVTHGTEGVRLKGVSSSSRAKWTVEEVMDALREIGPPGAAEEIESFGATIATHGGYWQPGAAAYPTMSAYVPIGPEGTKRSVLAVYADPSGPGAPRVSLNFGSLQKDLSEEDLAVFLAELEHSEVIARHLERVRREGFNTYPPIPLTDFVEGRGGVIVARALTPHMAS
jgi:hypothetical protein